METRPTSYQNTNVCNVSLIKITGVRSRKARLAKNIAEFKVSAEYLLLETSLHIIYKQGVNYFCSSRDTIKVHN